jgi:putative ABC transport system ATP-binding protein
VNNIFMKNALLELKTVRREIASGNRRKTTLAILDNVNLSLQPGETLALIGRSGVGKTTLLHLIAGLDRPDSGEIHFHGQSLGKLSAAELALMRRRRMGLVFQNNLSLPALPVWENAALPLLLEGMPRRAARAQARDWLKRVGVAQYENASTATLSGGQRRRLGLARALITRPALLLADEPTSDLDEATAAEIESLLFGFLKATSTAAIIVTHAESLERQAQRIMRLEAGRLHETAFK